MFIGRICRIYFAPEDRDNKPYGYVLNATNIAEDHLTGGHNKSSGFLGMGNMKSAAGADLDEVVANLSRQLYKVLSRTLGSNFDPVDFSFEVNHVKVEESGLFWPGVTTYTGNFQLSKGDTEDE